MQQVSANGLDFIRRHEGFVSTAYLDPVGVPTIGYGFTWGSRLFRAFWIARGHRKLAAGQAISRADADLVLAKLLDEEYGPMVTAALGALPEPVFDAAVSAVYNLGPKALTWKWAKAVKARDLATAARLLEQTGTSARGKRLPGLVRRRAEEAALLLQGAYGDPRPAPAAGDVAEAQQALKQLGFDPGVIDGLLGSNTKAALQRYQRAHPHLVADGILGPATLTQLRKDVATLKDMATDAGGIAGGIGGAGFLSGLSWQTILILVVAAAVLVVVVIAWRRRDVIARKFASWRLRRELRRQHE